MQSYNSTQSKSIIECWNYPPLPPHHTSIVGSRGYGAADRIMTDAPQPLLAVNANELCKTVTEQPIAYILRAGQR